MKIAIYHGFLVIHFEMIGYVIDYFRSSNIDIDIYSPLNDIGIEWRDYYQSVFKIPLNFLNPESINPEIYDLIFLLTDDDYSFKEEWIQQYGSSKVITIDHTKFYRRDPVLMKIAVRFSNVRPHIDWALPCYQAITMNEKYNIINNEEKISVACIGQNVPPSGEYLKNLFENFEEINFYVVSRILNKSFDDYQNIYCYKNCSTEIMMDIFKKSSYVLCFDNPNGPDYINTNITAAVPLSFNNGCQLIMPSFWQVFYNFNSCLTYDNSKLLLPKIPPLELIYDELYDLQSHRNRVFDKALNIKYPNLNLTKPINCWYSNLVNILKLYRPNIFIESLNFSESNIDNVIIDFRDKYGIYYNENQYIDNKNKYINERNIFIHFQNENQYKLEYILKNMAEPILFSLDIFNNNDLHIIGKRHFKDIIVINNFTLLKNMDDNIIVKLIKNYNRQSTFYICENDKLILLPQR